MRETNNRTRNVFTLRALAFVMAVALIWAMTMNVSAASSTKTYSSVDAFAKTTSIKGIQGVHDTDYGVQHSLRNCDITECVYSASDEWVQKGYVAPFEYEGETYYFGPPNIFTWLELCNEAGITTSIVFTVKYDENKLYLIDESARESGHTYYMPASSGLGGKTIKAFFAYVCELCIEDGVHIDNFILGNEVNSPYSWNYSGSADASANATKYADAFYNMYSAVRQYTDVSRCSISVDHSWQDNDEGRAIPTKTYIDLFAARLEQHESDIDWCVSYHLYPAVLYETDIWADSAHITSEDLNPKSDSARFVDGNNLYVMTNYIRDTYGEEHRIMLTEQGFSSAVYGNEWQAAALAYSYYAAMYDSMVDSFILNVQDETAGDSRLDFSIEGKLAESVYRKIDTGNADDAAWIDSNILPIIGVSSWSSIVPNYGTEVERGTGTIDTSNVDMEQVTAFVTRLYEKALNRTPEEDGLNNWVTKLATGKATGAEVAQGFFFSEEMENKNLSNEDFVELLYVVMMNRASDEGGKADWVEALESGFGRGGVFKGFAESAEFAQICSDYGIKQGKVTVTGNDYNRGLSGFIARLYTKALGRDYEETGLDDWCDRIRTGEWSVNDMSTTGFFSSEEFLNKNLDDEAFVETLYQTFMNRSHDESGYAYWLEKLKAGTSREDVVLGFSNSQEFADIKEDFGL